MTEDSLRHMIDAITYTAYKQTATIKLSTELLKDLGHLLRYKRFHFAEREIKQAAREASEAYSRGLLVDITD